MVLIILTNHKYIIYFKVVWIIKMIIIKLSAEVYISLNYIDPRQNNDLKF